MKRHCLNCKKDFKCNGECKDPLRIRDDTACFCYECWFEHILPKVGIGIDKRRLKCPIIPKKVRDKLIVVYVMERIGRKVIIGYDKICVELEGMKE